MIKDSIAINRPAAEVFAYLDQLDRHGEWQDTLLSVKVETEGPTRVGTRGVERRKVPGGARDIPYEITAHESPRRALARYRWSGSPGRHRDRGSVGGVELAHDARARAGGVWPGQALCHPGTTPGCQGGTRKPQEAQSAARERRWDNFFRLIAGSTAARDVLVHQAQHLTLVQIANKTGLGC